MIEDLAATLEGFADRGAQLTAVARTPQARTVWAVRVPAPSRAPRVLVLAGMHAPEVLGIRAALALIDRRLRGEGPAAELIVVPCIDRDGLAAGTLTDFETLLPRRSEPIGAALWPWLLDLGRVDVLLSLHSAAHPAPGAFVYADARSPDVLQRWSRSLPDLPWADADPTGLASETVHRGVFRFPHAAAAGTMTARLWQELAPGLLVVTEVPPAVAPSLRGQPLEVLHRASGAPPPDTCFLPLERQVAVMVAMADSGVAASGRFEHPPEVAGR